MSIVGSTITMNPLSAQIGTNLVTLSITDGLNIVTYTLNVVVINDPSIFATATAAQSLSAGASLIYPLPAITDTENDVVTFTLIAPLISFVSMVGTVITMAPSIITASGTSLV